MENAHLRVEIVEGGKGFEVRPVKSGDLVARATFAHGVRTTTEGAVSEPVWGKGRETKIVHDNGWETTLRLFERSPFLHVHTLVRNSSAEPFVTESIQPLDMTVGFGGRPVMSLGTGGLAKPSRAKGTYAFHAFADPETRTGLVTAWLTHERGVGVFFPREQGGTLGLKAQIDFGHYRVEPGATRPTETLLVGWFDDARLGLEGYADSVAKHYDIALAPKPGVYCTWYHAGASDEKKIAANTKFAAKHLMPFGLTVMQIDDKWQAIRPKGFKHEGRIKTTGPVKVFVDSKSNYPNGMAHTAKAIAAQGMAPGIWFMPFAGNFRNPYFDPEVFARNPDGSAFHDARWSGTCVDMSSPKAEKFVRERVRRIYDWGYRYFKIDGMHTGLATYNIYVNTSYSNKAFGRAKLHDPGATHVEVYRKGLRVLREEGPGAFILGCNVSQNMRSMGPAFGMIDGMRIGPDNGSAGGGNWGGVRVGAWHGTNLYFLNGRVWHNDPDPIYVRGRNPIERARWMCSWLAVSGAMHTSSEDYARLKPERLDLLKRCLPGHDLEARPVDLFETNEPRIWLVRDARLSVVGLFNWSDKQPADIKYDMTKLGLDGETRYVGFDFWKDSFVPAFGGELNQALPPATCRILALREEADYPQVVSTSRHITQGLIDVLDERWDARARTLSGRGLVVAGDAYELRIVASATGSTWRVKSCRVSAADSVAGVTINSRADGANVRATVKSPVSRTVEWAIEFDRAPPR